MRKNFLLIITLLLLTALVGCGNTDGKKKKAVVVKISDYGAVGDGVTDDSMALDTALDMVRVKGRDDTPVILEFEKDKVYYFADMYSEPAIFTLKNYKDLTVRGDNTTLLLDRTNQTLKHWFLVDQCQNLKIEGFNLKWAKDDYALAKVNAANLSSNPYIDVTTDRSLGITETIETLSDAFAIPYVADSNGMHLNRMHLYLKAIEPLDVSANKYRIHINPIDGHVKKIKHVVAQNLSIILGIPGWAPYVGENGSGTIVVTGTENIELERINVWDSAGGVFHMRYNTGVVHVHDCNVTPEPGTNDLVASWRDIFHIKDNRAQFIIEDCVLEKSYDDAFNFSVTAMEVTQVITKNEAQMSCEQTGGYWSPIKVGDVVTFVNEDGGFLVGRTRVKEVVEQGITTHLVLEHEMPKLQEGVTVYVDSLGQAGSIIRNCKVSGTYRFRTEITVEDCELNTVYAWIDNDKRKEGPIPRNITFRRCDFNAVKPKDSSVSFGDSKYMMQIGSLSSAGTVRYDNIVFEDCDIDHKLINFMKNNANVSFIKDGKEYLSVKSRSGK